MKYSSSSSVVCTVPENHQKSFLSYTERWFLTRRLIFHLCAMYFLFGSLLICVPSIRRVKTELDWQIWMRDMEVLRAHLALLKNMAQHKHIALVSKKRFQSNMHGCWKILTRLSGLQNLDGNTLQMPNYLILLLQRIGVFRF